MSAATVRALSARPLGGYRLWVHFDDGLAGAVDLGSVITMGCFSLLRDRRLFATVRVDPETGNIRWPQAGVYLHAFILHDDLVARGGGVALPTPGADAVFRRFMERATNAQDGPAEPYLAMERARLDKNARISRAAKSSWTRRRQRKGKGAT